MSTGVPGDAERERLTEQYGLAVEEYRFQVDLNWRRSQYYFVLCAALLGASFALLANGDRIARVLIGLAFLATLVITGLAVAASVTQHGYYRAARGTKSALEKRLGVGEYALETTPGMGGRAVRRIGKVRTFQNSAFAALALISLVGLLTTLGVFGEAAVPRPASGTVVETVCTSVSAGFVGRGGAGAPGIRCTTRIRP